MNNYYFIEAEAFRRAPFSLDPIELPYSWSRPLVLGTVTLIAVALHAAFLIWYLNRPAPDAFTETKALPMIDIALVAPNSGALVKSVIPAEPLTPMKPEVKKTPPKPKPKLKPKLIPKPVKKSLLTPEPTKPELTESAAQTKASPVEAPPANVTAVSGTHSNSTSERSEHSQVKVTSARVNANYLNNPAPHYSDEARKNHLEGTVILRVQVNPEGACSDIFVKRSSGHKELDDSALIAVKKWRFIPGKRGDAPIVSWVTVPIEFELS
ncbi:MAG: TonB family protein [Methylococcales bacterium]